MNNFFKFLRSLVLAIFVSTTLILIFQTVVEHTFPSSSPLIAISTRYAFKAMIFTTLLQLTIIYLFMKSTFVRSKEFELIFFGLAVITISFALSVLLVAVFEIKITIPTVAEDDPITVKLEVEFERSFLPEISFESEGLFKRFAYVDIVNKLSFKLKPATYLAVLVALSLIKGVEATPGFDWRYSGEIGLCSTDFSQSHFNLRGCSLMDNEVHDVAHFKGLVSIEQALEREMANSAPAPRGTAAAAAGMRRRRTASAGGGGGGGASSGISGNMLQFYTDDAPGLKISPNVVLVMSIGFIAFAAILHVIGKLYLVPRSAGSSEVEVDF